MTTAREEVEYALSRLKLAREITRTPTDADAEELDKALDYVYGYVATAMASLNRTLAMLEEQE